MQQETFGRFVRQRRIALALTLEALAERAGVHPNTASLWGEEN